MCDCLCLTFQHCLRPQKRCCTVEISSSCWRWCWPSATTWTKDREAMLTGFKISSLNKIADTKSSIDKWEDRKKINKTVISSFYIHTFIVVFVPLQEYHSPTLPDHHSGEEVLQSHDLLRGAAERAGSCKSKVGIAAAWLVCASIVSFTIYRPLGSTCAKWILEIVFAVSLPPTTELKSMLWVIQAFGYSHMQSKTLNYSQRKWGPRLSWLLGAEIYKWKRDTCIPP